MKKLREMKKNNKGFSLVELIVVIAIMVVLVAVLGSTILGYIDESKYSKDIQALDAIDTAMSLLIADPNSNWSAAKITDTNTDGCTLKDLMDVTKKDASGNDVYVNKVLHDTLAEVFKTATKTGTGSNGAATSSSDYQFNNSSLAFEDTYASDVTITVTNGAVSITVPSKDPANFDDYKSPAN